MTETLKYNSDEILEIAKTHDVQLLESLGFEVGRNHNVKCACPIHGGDNLNAFTYTRNTKFGAVWKCWTHQCDKKYGSDLIALVRAIKNCTFYEAVNYILKVANIDGLNRIVVNDNSEFIRNSQIMKEDIEDRSFDPDIVNNISHEVNYFLKRGFSQSILNDFKAFYCNDKTKSLYGRACLPIFNDKNEIVGFTGRKTITIDPNNDPSIIKWKHTAGFVASRNLFGINRAKEHHRRDKVAILVEGPLDVMKCHEAGLPHTISPFGINFSNSQRKLLILNGVSTLVVAFDPDAGGDKGYENVLQQAKLYFNVENARPRLTKDPGEMTIEEVQSVIGSILQQSVIKEKRRYGGR